MSFLYTYIGVLIRAEEDMKLVDLENVLLISHELSMTGAPIALHYLARQLKKDGIFTVILSPKDGPLKSEIINDGFTVIVDDSITGSTEWLKWAKGFDCGQYSSDFSCN